MLGVFAIVGGCIARVLQGSQLVLGAEKLSFYSVPENTKSLKPWSCFVGSEELV